MAPLVNSRRLDGRGSPAPPVSDRRAVRAGLGRAVSRAGLVVCRRV